MQKIDEYLKIKDAADLVGVSPSTLRNWERQGKLNSHRNPHNSYRLYKQEDLQALLSEISNSIEEKIETERSQ
ncbi:helix-turn-helix domain-containing protein [Chlamydiales bacterium]|nr:helix-turn-helix domain-containing protein [Chlamydiales bacterium]